jgi:hypothetical protein
MKSQFITEAARLQKLAGIITESQYLEEVNWKSLAASAAMTLGTLGAQGQTTEPITPVTEPTTQTTQKSQFGTPEQRAEAKAKREAQRKVNFDNFIKGAYIKGFIEKVNEQEFKSGCDLYANKEADYLDGTSLETPDLVYRELEDGTLLKIDLKKYQKYIKTQNKKPDVGIETQGPNFKPTSCGISKAASKQSKKDWKRK